MNPENSRGEAPHFIVTDLNAHGQGVTRNAEGKICFVANALPGETIEAETLEEKRNFAVLTVRRHVLSSPARVLPKCKHFGACGGCDLQHLRYEEQVAYKRKKVFDALTRIAGINLDLEAILCVPSPEEWNYRNKSQFPFRKLKGGHNHLVMYRKGSHDLVPISHCDIQPDGANAIMNWISENAKIKAYNEISRKGVLRNVVIRSVGDSAQFMIVFVATENHPRFSVIASEARRNFPEVVSLFLNINKNANNVIFGEDFQLLAGTTNLQAKFMGLEIFVQPNSFLQINTHQAEQLYRYAIDSAKLSSDDVALELYCGIGILTALLAKRSARSIGIDSVPSAIADAKSIAQRNGIENVDYICAKVEDSLDTIKRATVLFLDPPRKGCDGTVLESICAAQPTRVIYISCDPATLARDLQILVSKGGYELTEVRAFDMFPHTTHVEAIAVLKQKTRSE